MKKINYNPKQVRLFLVLALVFCFILTLNFTKSSNWQTRIFILAAEFVFLGFFFLMPRLFFPVFRIILILSGLLGNFIYAVITILVYYFILTPLSLLMRLFGKKFLHHKINPSLQTYYEDGIPNTDVTKQF
jgi:hypothetical protein